jgi:hypothetical protein
MNLGDLHVDTLAKALPQKQSDWWDVQSWREEGLRRPNLRVTFGGGILRYLFNGIV